MHDMRFEWDEDKNKQNQEKHGISFNEALTIFADDNARLILDEDHSEDEDRFILIGISKNAKLLTVCHCYRESDSVIRLISARKASKSESEQYGGV